MKPCRECGASVDWRKIDGKRQCFDAGTDTVHWDLCSKRRWELVKKTGERFEDRKLDDGRVASGYANSVHGTKYDRITASKVTTSPGLVFYGDHPCKKCVPPWEVCPNNCPATKNSAYRPINGVTEFILT